MCTPCTLGAHNCARPKMMNGTALRPTYMCSHPYGGAHPTQHPHNRRLCRTVRMSDPASPLVGYVGSKSPYEIRLLSYVVINTVDKLGIVSISY